MPDLAMVPDRFGIASIFAAACNQRDNVACAMPVSAESRDAEIACGGRSRATIRALIVSEYGFIFSRFFSPAVHVVRSATLPRSGCNYADRAGEHLGIPFQYERTLEGRRAYGRQLPDFSFETPQGSMIVWEHLGMLHDSAYRRRWEEKREWYRRNGFVDGETLFVSQDLDGALDSRAIRDIALAVRARLAPA